MWDPVENLRSLRDTVGRMVEVRLVRPLGAVATGRIFLPLDLYETEDDVIVEMAAPGYRPEDLNVSIENDTVTIHGEAVMSSEARDTSYWLRERRRGSFNRTIRLPIPVKGDLAEASFDNGVIRLRLPKAEAVKSHRIPIRSTSAHSRVRAARAAATAEEAPEIPDDPNVHPTI
jgi:HSP20 family protein